jgi:hypothetical protein
MNIVFSNHKIKNLTVITGWIFLIFWLFKSTIYSIENYDNQLNQDKTRLYINQIELLTTENQKLKQAYQDIYQPYHKFLNCRLSLRDSENYQDIKIEINQDEILNLESRHLKGKTPVQIKKIIYKPEEQQKNNKKIILIAAHGTMSSWHVFGYGKSASSLAIQHFALEIAQIYKCQVELIIINWGGELSQKRRLKVGSALGDYVLHHHQKNAQIWGIGHSHGCNILNNMAERLRSKKIKADKFILIAPIYLDIKPNQKGLNIEECYNFYSCGDIIQAAGSSQNGSAECVRFFPQCPETKSYFIQVFPNNAEVDHLTIKIVVLEQLTKLICQIKKNFPMSSYLNAVVFKNSHEPIIVLDEENEGFDNNKYLTKFFKLQEFEELIEKQNQINEKNKKKLTKKFGQNLFKSNSQIKSIFNGLKAIIQQRSKYPWFERQKP